MYPDGINPIFYEIHRIRTRNPHIKIAEIADEINSAGFRKREGRPYSRADISHLYVKYLPKYRQLEMKLALKKIRSL
jgi:hypothetical protein